MKILITGATGFLGSNIAKFLLKKGNTVFATHRSSSSFEKCFSIKDKVNWINIDERDWKKQIKLINVEQLIHVAWEGIDTENRNNWELQLQNFWLSKMFFDLANESGVKKIIAIGSQAEYGLYKFAVDENTVPMPEDAYGAIKTLTANYMRNVFERSQKDWYWIRIFSVFGEGENIEWLIPTVISKLLRNEQVLLTQGEQEYNYLYIGDFLNQLYSVVESNENKSGIYNLCHKESIKIKDLVKKIADLIKVSQKLIQFGAIPYRPDQNMFISGDNSKLRKTFPDSMRYSNEITTGLIKTINFYKDKIL